MRAIWITGLVVLGANVAPSPVTAEIIHLHAALTGTAEVPAVDTAAHGSATLQFDTETEQLQYEITYDGLSGPATSADIRGPARRSETGTRMRSFPVPDSPISGTATLTKAQAAQLLAEQYYIDIHTSRYPDGEIRGQIEK